MGEFRGDARDEREERDETGELRGVEGRPEGVNPAAGEGVRDEGRGREGRRR